MAQRKTSSLALTEEDRAVIAQVREILEKEHKGLRYSMLAIIRVVLFFFLDAKKAQQTKK